MASDPGAADPKAPAGTANPQTQTDSKSVPPSQPLNRPIPPAGTTTNPATQNPGATNPNAATDAGAPDDGFGASETSVTQKLAAIRDSLENETITDAGAREVIQRMTNLRRRQNLRPIMRADSWYVEMLAHVALDDDRGVCRAAAQVIAMHPNPERKGIARTATEGRNCQ